MRQPLLQDVRLEQPVARAGITPPASTDGRLGVLPNGICVLLSAEAARGSLSAPGIEVVGRVTRLPVTTSSFAEKTHALSPLRTDCVRWLGGVFMLLVMGK